MTDRTWALYRYWDAEDRLLYIGIAGDLASRENGHIKSSVWMRLTARSAVVRLPSRRAALDAERKAIETEHPIFNRKYNDSPEAVERMEKYVAECGIPDLLTAKTEPPEWQPEASSQSSRPIRKRQNGDFPTPMASPACGIQVRHSDAGPIWCGQAGVRRVGMDWLCLAHLGEASLKFEAVAAEFRQLENERTDRAIASAEAAQHRLADSSLHSHP